MQIANFIVGATLILAGVRGLSRTMRSGWGPRLLGVYGLALLAAGVFPIDPTNGYPAELVHPVQTTAGILHGFAGLCCFNALMLGAFVVARYFGRRELRWALYSLATALTVGVCNYGSLVSSVLNASGVATDAPTGLIQRIAIVVGWTWFAALALHERRSAAPSQHVYRR